MHKITIMSKPDCHLCDVAAKVVQDVVGSRIPVLIEKVDITSDQELLEKYRYDIPVILIDGVERFRHTIDPDKLARIFLDEPGENLLGLSS